MRKYETRIEGIGSLPKGNYSSILVEGVGTIRDQISFERLRVDGTCKANGALTGDDILVDGTLKVNGTVHLKQLVVNGAMNVLSGNVYGDEIRVNGLLQCRQEVSADRIIVDGCMQADAITGDEIRLNYRDFGKWNFLTSLFGTNKLFPKVDEVSCTTLCASYLRAKRIAAQHITLTNRCDVDLIVCDGTLHIDSTCHVLEIQGNYTLV